MLSFWIHAEGVHVALLHARGQRGSGVSLLVLPCRPEQVEREGENIVVDEEDSSAVSDLLVDNSEPKWYDVVY